MDPAALSYCGAPPEPGELLRRWNLDPTLIGVWLCSVFACELVLRRRHDARAPGHRAALRAGASVALLAWISPLCALGVALFSARVAQHVVLVLVAAPLLARAAPERDAPSAREAFASFAAFAAATWFWHAPGPYLATFRSDAVYWAMHATSLASAIAVWRVLLCRPSRFAATPTALALATCFQMSALGALFTFAPAPLLAPHLATAPAWGLSALEDQQLGGLVIWIPGCAALLVAGLAPLATWLKEQEGGAPRAAL